MEQIMSLIGNVDKKTWVLAGILAGVLALIAILKKAIKLAIAIIVIAISTTFGGRYISDIKEKVGISVVGNNIHIDNDIIGKYELDIATVENVIIKNGSNDGKAELDITVKGKAQTIEIDEKLIWIIKTVLNKSGIDTVDLRK